MKEMPRSELGIQLQNMVSRISVLELIKVTEAKCNAKD